MLTEDQKKRVLAEIQNFGKKVSEYIHKKSELNECEKDIQIKMEALPKVTEEDRQIEAAMEVLYGENKKESRAKKIEEELKLLHQKLEKLQDELNYLKTDLLRQMRNLPIPADLENPRQEDSELAFPFFEGAEFGKEGIAAMCDLFRQEQTLNFGAIRILPDKVIVENVSEKKEAVSKLVEGIRSFRMRVDDLLKSYEQIDEMVERLKKSELYTEVLKALAKKGRLSTNEIAKMLNIDDRKAYDACYNLTRSNWSPTPIQKTASGEWELTLSGEILVNRLFEKYGTNSE